jgi:uncharacterized protein YjbI with pentapeptide repeats
LRSNGIIGSPTLPAASRVVHGYIVAVGVNLTGANLVSHDLSDLDLTGTIFTNANLHGAKLDRTNLTRANFKDASVNAGSSFASTNGRPAVLPTGYRWHLNSLQKL